MAPTLDSVCPLDCPDTCSLSVTVDGGRLTKVDGSDRNPLTAGYICAKVRRYPERVYSPLRIQTPQRRIGAKGEARFAPITWEEAIDTIARRFQQIIAEDGPEAILPYHYGGSNGVFGDGATDARFFNRLGASELLKTLCAAPTGTTYRAMYGTMGGVPPQDYRLARAILLWGVNPAATSIHLVPQVNAARRAGAFVAVIDPRRPPLARSASLHLQPLPGTDVVLALAMINELIGSGRADHAFIAQHVSGFETLAAAAAEYPLRRAAEICDVRERDIAALVEAYAAASPAVIRCGWGVERNRNGGNAGRAILALPAIAGKFGVRGGGMTMSLGRTFPLDAAALARPDLRRTAARTINMTQLGRVLTTPQTPPIRALFVYNANPVAMTPNQNLILRGLAREELFTVVHDQVLTDTARFADILLPATTVFEQPELHKSYGHYWLQYSDPVIPPVGESLSNPELFARLARAMGFTDAALAPDTDALLHAALAGAGTRLGPAARTPEAPALRRPPADVSGGRVGVSSMDRSPLRPSSGQDWSLGSAKPDRPLGGAKSDTLLGDDCPQVVRRTKLMALRFGGGTELIQLGTDFPTTASGRIELCPASLGPVAYQPLPQSNYPLTLISPATDKTINSIFGEFNVPPVRLQISPADAAARGIADGAVVRVYNDLGEVHAHAQVSGELRTGVVSIPKGLWRSATLNGATATALAPDHLTDIGAGACFNDARVEVEVRE